MIIMTECLSYIMHFRLVLLIWICWETIWIDHFKNQTNRIKLISCVCVS